MAPENNGEISKRVKVYEAGWREASLEGCKMALKNIKKDVSISGELCFLLKWCEDSSTQELPSGSSKVHPIMTAVMIWKKKNMPVTFHTSLTEKFLMKSEYDSIVGLF